MPDDAYSINDLSRLTGLNVRTIRYYLSQGLIPASGESGPGAHYGQGHLDRLRLIKRLQTQYLPNAEIRRRLAPLSDMEVATVLNEQGEQPVVAERGAALDYIRNLLGTATDPDAPRVMAPPAPGGSIAPEPPRLFALASRSAPLASMPRRLASVPDHVAEATDGTKAAEASANAAAVPPTANTELHETSPYPERSQWERLTLADNIELHIRRPLSRIEQRRVERLITIARQVLTEDQS